MARRRAGAPLYGVERSSSVSSSRMVCRISRDHTVKGKYDRSRDPVARSRNTGSAGRSGTRGGGAAGGRGLSSGLT